MAKPPATISLMEAAAMIGVSRDTARRLALAGELEGWRVSDRGWMKVDLHSVREFLSRRRRANFHGSSKTRKQGRTR